MLFLKVVAEYEIKNGKRILEEKYPDEFAAIYEIINEIDAAKYKTKKSKEKTMLGKMLYNPPEMNDEFKRLFKSRNWHPIKVKCDYSSKEYIANYSPTNIRNPYREMDYVKNKVGVEVQFGKYAFMVYNVSSKMTIFHKHGYVDVGVEIVPVYEMAAKNMSTGVSHFEQFIWDLSNRGVANIDIPVLVLGIIPVSLFKENKQKNQNISEWIKE